MVTPHDNEDDKNGDLYDDPEPCNLPKLLQTLKMKQPLKYSTWEWSGENDFAPIDLRDPSPPLDSVSIEYRAIDAAIKNRKELANRATEKEHNADRIADQKDSAHELREGLVWREEQFLKAKIKLELDRTYQFMPPWPLELKEQCVKHKALLDRYYHVEAQVGALVKERLRYYDQLKTIMEFDEQMRSEISMLNKVREAREKDEKEGNDFVVLGMVLDEVETRLNKDIERLADGTNMGDEDVQEILTELPDSIGATIFSGDHPELAMRFSRLVQRERDLFPSRFEQLTKKKSVRFDVGEKPSFDRKRASPNKQKGSKKKTKGEGSSDRKHADDTNNEGSKDDTIRFQPPPESP